MLDQLRVNVDSRYSCVERGRPQVEQSRCAGPDQDDSAFDVFPRNISGQHLPGRNVCCLIEVAEFEIYTSAGVCRHFDVAYTYVIKACRLSESRLATRV